MRTQFECASEVEGCNDKCTSETNSHYDDCWLEEDSLDSVVTEETFLDDESFSDNESFLLLDDNKKLEDDTLASHDYPRALTGDKAPAEGGAVRSASSALDPTAASWHPLRGKPVLLDPDALPWHPTEDAAEDVVPVAGTKISESLVPGTAAKAVETMLVV